MKIEMDFFFRTRTGKGKEKIKRRKLISISISLLNRNSCQVKREIKDFALEQAKGKRSFPSHILHDMNSHLSPSLFFTFLHFSSFDFLSCLYKKFLWNWKKARCVLYRKRLLIQKRKRMREMMFEWEEFALEQAKGKGKWWTDVKSHPSPFPSS